MTLDYLHISRDDSYLTRDLAVIKAKLEALKPEAILLYGSHARGEGARIKINGTEYAYNDYDVLLLFEKSCPGNDYEKIKQELIESTKVKWFDIAESSINSDTQKQKTVFNYDLNHFNRLIFGDQGTVDKYLIPFENSEIPLREAEVLLTTRLWCFFGSMSNHSEINSLSGSDLSFFHYQLAKAIFAITDSEMIIHGNYQTKYAKKISEYIRSSHRILSDDILTWAYTIKIHPQEIRYRTYDSLELYDLVYKHYHEAILHLYENLFKQPLESNPTTLLQLKTHTFKYRILSMLSILDKYEKKYRKYSFNVAQLFLFFAYPESAHKLSFLDSCRTYLSQSLKREVTTVDWSELKEIIIAERTNV